MNRLKNLFDDITTTEVTRSLVDELIIVRVTLIFFLFYYFYNLFTACYIHHNSTYSIRKSIRIYDRIR